MADQRWIEVTREAANAVRASASLPFRDRSRPLPNGNVELPLDDETVAMLDRVRLPGESYSDVMIRLAAYYRSGGRLN